MLEDNETMHERILGIHLWQAPDNLCKISDTWNGKLCTILWLMDSEVVFSGKVTESQNNTIHRLFLGWGRSSFIYFTRAIEAMIFLGVFIILTMYLRSKEVSLVHFKMVIIDCYKKTSTREAWAKHSITYRILFTKPDVNTELITLIA